MLGIVGVGLEVRLGLEGRAAEVTRDQDVAAEGRTGLTEGDRGTGTGRLRARRGACARTAQVEARAADRVAGIVPGPGSTPSAISQAWPESSWPGGASRSMGSDPSSGMTLEGSWPDGAFLLFGSGRDGDG